MKKLILLIIPLFIIFQGCQKSHQDTDKLPYGIPDSLVHCNILRVEGPSTSLLNQTVTLVVYYPASSGCDYVSIFSTVQDSKNIMIKAYGGTLRNTTCTTGAVPKTINYDFSPVEKGVFVFKFINRDNSIISHNLTVN